MDDIEIRTATNEDVVALARLITELGAPTTRKEMAGRMEAMRGRGDFATLVAIAGGEVTGMVGLSVSPSFVRNTLDGRIIAMVVAKMYRGRGIGRALMARAEAWFADKGVKRVTLTSGLHRAQAHTFYRSCGYEQTGLRFVHIL